MSKGVLTVVSGFSGAGKGTVMKRLLEKYENYALSISVTTRKPREGERDGIEYFFRTREEVEAMIQEDQLLEHAEYVGNYYGTPRFYVEDMLSQGKNGSSSGICNPTYDRRTSQPSDRPWYRNG